MTNMPLLYALVSPLVAVVPSLATLGTGRNMLVFVLNEGNETAGEERSIGA